MLPLNSSNRPSYCLHCQWHKYMLVFAKSLSSCATNVSNACILPWLSTKFPFPLLNMITTRHVLTRCVALHIVLRSGITESDSTPLAFASITCRVKCPPKIFEPTLNIICRPRRIIWKQFLFLFGGIFTGTETASLFTSWTLCSISRVQSPSLSIHPRKGLNNFCFNKTNEFIFRKVGNILKKLGNPICKRMDEYLQGSDGTLFTGARVASCVLYL